MLSHYLTLEYIYYSNWYCKYILSKCALYLIAEVTWTSVAPRTPSLSYHKSALAIEWYSSFKASFPHRTITRPTTIDRRSQFLRLCQIRLFYQLHWTCAVLTQFSLLLGFCLMFWGRGYCSWANCLTISFSSVVSGNTSLPERQIYSLNIVLNFAFCS